MINDYQNFDIYTPSQQDINEESPDLDFMSELFNESDPLDECIEKMNMDMAVSICSDFPSFKDGLFDDKPNVLFCQGGSAWKNEVLSTNDELANEQVLECESSEKAKHYDQLFSDILSGPADFECQDKTTPVSKPQNPEQNVFESKQGPIQELNFEDIAMPSKSIDFWNIQRVLLHIFNGDQVHLSVDNKLNFEERWIVEKFLLKTFRQNLKFQDYNYNINFLKTNIRRGKAKRSSEELIKKIYRPFLRNEFEQFKGKHIQFKNMLKDRDCAPQLFSDKTLAFFVELFVGIENLGQLDFDVKMDILTEKTKSLVYSNRVLKKSQNWQTVKKAKFPSKISKSLRFLVASQESTRLRFINYLEKHAKFEFSTQLKHKIDSDIINKLKSLEKMYLVDCQGNFETFQSKVDKKLMDRSFKLQWPFWEVQDAVGFCRKDLDNKKLELEYKRIQQKHYSYIKM